MTYGPADFDPRDVPTYAYADVARYLGLPASTVRAWVRGAYYSTREGERRVFKPVIERPDPDDPMLSFTNLVEIHVLSAIRRTHKVSLQKVREALDYLHREFPTPHPLARVDLQTDGVDLFLEIWGQILALSGPRGQMEMRAIVEAYLNRIERDEAGLAARLYPFTRRRHREAELAGQPRVVVIDPRVSFGQPILVGTGIPTSVLAERFKAGETALELAADYRCDTSLVEEAIRCELSPAA